MSEPVTKTFIELIAQNKENDAYRFLYQQYHATLLQFATAYLKVKEPAEEIVNDVLHKVWLKKEQLAEVNHLRAYLFTAVRNSCLSFLARQKQEQQLASAAIFKEISTDDPESLVICSELNDRIKTTIREFPPRCKQIYELIRIEGLRNKDVAEKLNISVNTIDVQLAIALKRLIKTVNSFNQ